MTCTRPWRRITLHFSQIFLTLGRTFTAFVPFARTLPGTSERSCQPKPNPSDGSDPCDQTLACVQFLLLMLLLVLVLLVLLVPIGDPTTSQVVRCQLNLDAITGENTDVMHPHLSGDVGQHFVAVFEFDAEHGVRQRLGDRSFQNDRVFFGLSQDTDSCVMDLKTPAQDRAKAGSRTRAD